MFVDRQAELAFFNRLLERSIQPGQFYTALWALTHGK